MVFTCSRGLYKGLSVIYLVSSMEQIGLPGGTVVENLPANAGDTGYVCSIPRSGRSLGVGTSKPLQYSGLENSMNSKAWPATVHGYTKSQSQTRLSDWAHTWTRKLPRATPPRHNTSGCFDLMATTSASTNPGQKTAWKTVHWLLNTSSRKWSCNSSSHFSRKTYSFLALCLTSSR